MSCARIASTTLVLGLMTGSGLAALEGDGLLDDGYRSHLELQTGVKLLDDKWADANVQGGIGVLFETRPLEGSFGFTSRILYSWADDSDDGGRGDLKVELTEGDIGINWFFWSTLRREFFLGGGLAVVDSRATLERKTRTETEHSTGFGAFVQAGGRYDIDATWSLSLTAVLSYVPVDSPHIVGDEWTNVGGAALLGGLGARF